MAIEATTEAVILPGTDPEAGVIVSQLPPLPVLAVAVKVRPVDLLSIATYRVAGETVPPVPVVAVNFKDFGRTRTEGLFDPKMRRKTLTSSSSEPALTVTLPEYIPGLSPVVVTPTVILPGVVPDAGVRVSQVPLAGVLTVRVAVQFKVLPCPVVRT